MPGEEKIKIIAAVQLISWAKRLRIKRSRKCEGQMLSSSRMKNLLHLLSAAWRGDMAWEVRAALFNLATAALKLKAWELTRLTPLVSD